jgi:FkbM family methyltransferase
MIQDIRREVVFDFGMFDAADSQYFLETGHRVIAVEANPALARRAETLLANYIATGQFTILNVAVSSSKEPVELCVSVDDLGSSTTQTDRLANHVRGHTYTVPGMTTEEILATIAPDVPKFVKIDLEGFDSMCVRALRKDTRPRFLSFEAGPDTADMLPHLQDIGYTRFKLIDQTSFRSIDRMDLVHDRLARAVVRRIGFAEPRYVRRGSRLFALGHSSGPAPWCSDGQWMTSCDVLTAWQRRPEKQNRWFDLQAC